MQNESPGWRDLKSEWQAGAPTDGAFWLDVRESLVRRIWLGRVWFAIEAVSFLFLGVVTMVNLMLSRFAAAAGVALIMALCLGGFVWARRGRGVGNLESLRGMVDLTLSRAHQARRIVYVSYAVIGILFIWTLAGLLTGQGWPVTADERFIGRIVWLTLSGGAAVAFHLHTNMRIQRFSALQRSFTGAQS